ESRNPPEGVDASPAEIGVSIARQTVGGGDPAHTGRRFFVRSVTARDPAPGRYPFAAFRRTVTGFHRWRYTMGGMSRAGILVVLAACGGGHRAGQADSAAMSSAAPPTDTTAM